MSDFFDEALKDMEQTVTEDEGEIGAEEWEPTNAGQALRGIFMKAVAKPTRYGTGYTVIIKDLDSDSYVKVWCKRTMLRRGVAEEAQPAQGSAIVFKYNGEKDADNGNTYHSYQVRAEKSDPEYWRGIIAQGVQAQMAFDNRGPAPVVPDPNAPDTDPF